MASTDDEPQVTLGYWLSSEEHQPLDLVSNAVRAEAHGFRTAMISDHLHPWTPFQGSAPFVWSVLGAIANATSRLRVGTGVTAPGVRSHPVNIAQASATTEALIPGRFFLGLGSGERLNEQGLGERWPSAGERVDRLEEAIGLIRDLWAGENVVHQGEWFCVENVELFTRPDIAPPIMVAGLGRAASLAGRLADGYIGVAPDADAVETFEVAGGRGKPRLAQIHVCWASEEDEARKTAHRWWPQVTLPPSVLPQLARPREFADAAQLATIDAVASEVACGPDPERHLEAIARFVAAGFTEIYIHQVGPDQAGFMSFYRDEILPLFTGGVGSRSVQ
jgi:coenzyme F420-dependent glucose-6-phosphate dehydrogenase